MIRRSTVMAIGRAANASFFLTTSAYCILSYSSFAYHAIIRPELFAWPSDFIGLYHVLFMLSWLITALTLMPYLRIKPRSRAAVAYLAVAAVAGGWLFATPFMASVDNSRRSLIAGLIALVFPLALAGVDHLTAPMPDLQPTNERRLLRTCWLTALVVWAAYAIAARYRLYLASGIDLSAAGVLMGSAASAVAHVMVFTAVLLMLAFLIGLVRITSRGARVLAGRGFRSDDAGAHSRRDGVFGRGVRARRRLGVLVGPRDHNRADVVRYRETPGG